MSFCKQGNSVLPAATANNEFAVNVFQMLVEKMQNGNLFFSPFSISVALAMTYEGARTRTAAQMAETLCYKKCGMEDKNVKEEFRKLMPIFYGDEQQLYTLHLASRLFAQDNFKCLDEFLSAVKKNFNATVGLVDFFGNSEGATKEINVWVEQQTKNKILNLLSSIDRETKLILVNAIYFKSEWLKTFNDKETQKLPFYITREKHVTTNLMTQRGDFKMVDDRSNQLKVLEMPYVNSALSMFMILPNEVDGLSEVQNTLQSLDVLNNLIDKVTLVRNMTITIPKFKLEQTSALHETLEYMGVTDLFSDQCDLSGMTGNKDLKVAQVIHKAFIEVNEEGSEAAAATAIRMVLMCYPPPTFPEFIADHPFLFLIRDNLTDSILFMGRFVQP